MVSISRLIIGGIFILIGALIFIFYFFNWSGFIFASLMVVLGIVILLNKNEDKIEERKDKLKSTNKNE